MLKYAKGDTARVNLVSIGWISNWAPCGQLLVLKWGKVPPHMAGVIEYNYTQIIRSFYLFFKGRGEKKEKHLLKAS